MRRILFLISAIVLSACSAASAQNRDIPYWAVLAFDEVNMRIGASEDFKIDWVYKRRGMPVKVIRVVEGWRRVVDHEGTEGWIAQSQLRLRRGGMVIGDGVAAMREAPADNGQLRWNVEPGVVGILGECEAGWCRFDVDGREGWVQAARLWGAGAP